MAYRVKEIFYTLQGEGFRAGRPCVMLRFSGCNLWSGRQEDRGASCSGWCDTDFRGGDRYTVEKLAARALSHWPAMSSAKPLVVLTGGEPSLQVDAALVQLLRAKGATVAMETNGTLPLDGLELDWITLSPKAHTKVELEWCSELKLVFPQLECGPEKWCNFPAGHRFLQPLWSEVTEEREQHARAASQYCLEHPEWRLSMQIHKTLGLP